MKKIFFVKLLLVFSIFALFSGCAKKEISNTGSVVKEEEAIDPNIVEPEEAKTQEEAEDKLEDGAIVGSVYFDFDKYDIRGDMQNVLDTATKVINENSDMSVLIEGNTDEFGSDEYNFALGNKRALVVKTALVTRGVDKDKIRVISLGKSKPICGEKTPECYQKNRRGDIKLVKQSQQ